MVDPGAAHAIVKLLNRWYRKWAKPHGAIDHFHRGTRMSYTIVYRVVHVAMSVFLLSVAALLYLVPAVMEGQSRVMVLLVKLGWVGIVCLAVLVLMQAVRECTIITDDGLIKVNLLGRETRMAWRDISDFTMKPDDNKVIFRSREKTKLTMSLAYDGWHDFLATTSSRLDPALYAQIHYTLLQWMPTAIDDPKRM
jgi:hypothetical protein